MHAAYLRQPTLCGDLVVFVADDDLWRVDAHGGTAQRLTAGLGEPGTPCLSPDGRWINTDWIWHDARAAARTQEAGAQLARQRGEPRADPGPGDEEAVLCARFERGPLGGQLGGRRRGGQIDLEVVGQGDSVGAVDARERRRA